MKINTNLYYIKPGNDFATDGESICGCCGAKAIKCDPEGAYNPGIVVFPGEADIPESNTYTVEEVKLGTESIKIKFRIPKREQK